MRLELGTFPVTEIRFGTKMRWIDGMLELDQDALLKLVRDDTRITNASLDLVYPGDSVRITKIQDVIEPRVKVEGQGVTYPGMCNRPITTVGSGRTHRLSQLGIVLVVESAVDRQGSRSITFLDMMPPGSQATPYGNLNNICLVASADTSLDSTEQNYALESAALKISDQIAAIVRDKEAPERELFELVDVDPELPKVVYICAFNSPQHYSNSNNAFGTAIYGMTRQTPPWFLHPNEILDGAICGGDSWILANNPVLLELYRGHGIDVNFLGCIAIRTRWSSQQEKDLTSLQAAKMTKMLGADGAIVTWDAAGNDFLEVIRTVQACEDLGVKTVLITPEEHPDIDGPPVLEPLPEANAIVSAGVGLERRWISEPVPVPLRVIGPETLVEDANSFEGTVSAWDSLPSPRFVDHYGFGRRSCFDY